MGQASSLNDSVDVVHLEVVRHAKVLSEISSLTYEDFKKCLDNLNALSRKCIDPNGMQLVFLVKRGSDSSVFWKATVKIASIKVNPSTRQIDSYKFLNLKQFLCVFKTFQSHLETLVSSEKQRALSRSGSQSPSDESIVASPVHRNLSESFMRHMDAITGDGQASTGSSEDTSTPSELDGAEANAACAHGSHVDECCICLERDVEVILPCVHSFCAPCIEQWNVNNKTCPICSERLASTDDTWVMPDIPGVEEINAEICAEFMNMSQNAHQFGNT